MGKESTRGREEIMRREKEKIKQLGGEQSRREEQDQVRKVEQKEPQKPKRKIYVYSKVEIQNCAPTLLQSSPAVWSKINTTQLSELVLLFSCRNEQFHSFFTQIILLDYSIFNLSFSVIFQLGIVYFVTGLITSFNLCSLVYCIIPLENSWQGRSQPLSH